MQLSNSSPDIDALLSQINAKKEAYDKAIREDKEFMYIQVIYVEIKELEKNYNRAIRARSTGTTGLSPLQEVSG